ncbi:Hypothetical predicted protein [Mytilus galloprovincialis]|uniref:Fibrinogen C-terminal domain-containing protein n=1 Tax=Mytilus galloprovincialis TaxID=29158 RepID=A0A8B6G0A8_MYTGA|nr:Hypothetical predicted protein [Mytilus galloprovincialis]
MDNDQLEDLQYPSCANQYSGGWWYRACYQSSLTGNILAWVEFRGEYYNLKHSKMMIRR